MTLHLFVRIETGAATDDVARALAACAIPTREEDGCLQYDIFRGADGATLFLKEEWESKSHLDAHMATPHLKAFAAALESGTGKSMGEVASLWEASPI